jgi:hypothetical protein
VRVYSLSGSTYDRATRTLFESVARPTVVKEITDEYGNVYKFWGHAVADVDPDKTVDVHGTPTTLRDYFRARDKTYHIVDSPVKSEPAGGVFEPVHRAGPWWDVVDPDGERVSDKALTRDDADALAAKLNAEGE